MSREGVPGRVRAILAVNVFLIIYLLGYFLIPGGQIFQYLWRSIVLFCVYVFNIIALTLAWRRAIPEERMIWWFLLVGIALWAFAEILWILLDIGRVAGAPELSAADVFWLLGYVPLIVGMVYHIARAWPHLSWNRLGLIALSMLLPFFAFVAFALPHLLRPRADTLASLVNGLYPVLDLLLAIGGVLSLFTPERDARWRPWHLISFAMLLLAYADGWYWLLTFWNLYAKHLTVDLTTTLRVDVPYLLGYFVLGLGAMQAVRSRFAGEDY